MSVAQERAWRIGRELDDAGPEASKLTLLDVAHGSDLYAVPHADVHWTGLHAASGSTSMGRGRDLIRGELERRLVAEHARDARFGDTIYRITDQPREWVVMSWEKLWELLVAASLKTGTHAGTLLGTLFPANKVRVSAVDAIALSLGHDTATMRNTVVDYARKHDRHGNPKEREMKVIPLEKAPTKLQALDDGEMR